MRRPSMATVTPDGMGMGALPMRDIVDHHT
jgi:hypothetical protein